MSCYWLKRRYMCKKYYTITLDPYHIISITLWFQSVHVMDGVSMQTKDHVNDTIHSSAFVESPSSQNLASGFRVLPGPHASHSVSWTSQVNLWPTISLGQAPTLDCPHPSTMTLTLAPQMHVSRCEWHSPNYNMGQYL